MFTDWVLKQVNFQSLVWFLLCLNITYIAWGTTTRLWGSSPVCVCLTLVTCLSSVWNLRKGNNTRDEKLVLNNVHEYHCSHMTFKTTTTICALSINHLALISLLLIIVLGVRLLSALRGDSFFSSPPQRPMTSNFEGFLYQILSITLFSYFNSWERASISLFNIGC